MNGDVKLQQKERFIRKITFSDRIDIIHQMASLTFAFIFLYLISTKILGKVV